MATRKPEWPAPKPKKSVMRWLLDSDPSIRWQVMRDLTVADIHTYYVVAGDTAVLVHNTSPACSLLDRRASQIHDVLKDPARKRGGRAWRNGTTAVVRAQKPDKTFVDVVAAKGDGLTPPSSPRCARERCRPRTTRTCTPS